MEKNKFYFRTNYVILMGDTHSESITRRMLTRIPEGSDVFHIGDVGLGFGKPEYALGNAKGWVNVFNDHCKEHDIRLYLNRGNHDNPAVWNNFSKENVVFVNTGDVGIFPNGKKVLCIGGGVSLDRCTRFEGIDYWSDEITPNLDIVEECDIVFSHDAPEHFNHATSTVHQGFGWYVERDPTLIADCYKQRNHITDLVARSKARFLISGHFHNTLIQEQDGVKYRSLSIEELYEIDATKI